MPDDRQFCTFLVDGLYFGIEVRDVQEVIRYQQMTRVPLSPDEIGGLINLRGQIVTAIDVRRRLELPAAPKDHLPMNVIVRTGDSAVSLLVDEIGDVIAVEPEMYEAVPETLCGVARDVVDGVYKLKDKLLLVLNIQKTVCFS